MNMALSAVVEAPIIASFVRSPISPSICIRPSTSPLFSPKITLTSTAIRNSPISKHPKYLSLPAAATDDAVLDKETEESREEELIKKKLYVGNLPWTFTVANMKELFGSCGTVADIEIIRRKDGKGRRFAFVTMTSGEEAQAIIDKFDAHEVSGRAIRIYLAKRLKKPPPKSDIRKLRAGETKHQVYASNLSWKVRGNHLREIFSATAKPVSCKVVFDTPSGRSAGYGFVSFQSREEAEAAINALHGKDLMGRALRLRLNEFANGDAKVAGQEDDDGVKTHLEEQLIV